jgi:hypothetical protein
MAIAGFLLLAGAVLGFAIWQSRPAAGAPRQLSTTLLMAVGALLAVTMGLGALAGAILLNAWARQEGDFGRSLGDLVLAAMPVGGFLVAGLGVWMFRRGRARVRAEAGAGAQDGD